MRSKRSISKSAWSKQSESLVEVQKQGSGFETVVREVLAWPRGKVVYDTSRNYTLQVDNVYPLAVKPSIIASVTYTNPDTKGHSNENKLQLKVGELALLKNAYPQIRGVLVIGGTGDTWLAYVLEAFRIFYDEVIYLWTTAGVNRLKAIAKDPNSVQIRNQELWERMRKDWETRKLAPNETAALTGLVRYRIADILKQQKPVVHHPSFIQNEIARLCMQRSRDCGGAEWESYIKERWNNIEMSRNFFNPVEAAVEITLNEFSIAFKGGIARDVPVNSLLHDLGMKGTSVSEDYVLYSEALKMPVYIQCKSSGGGRKQHGKNIQNRTKEQITRSIIYSCRSTKPGSIEWHPKRFHWIGILDGNWGAGRRQPLKYIHMLQLAGYDKLFCANDLITPQGNVKRNNNPLACYLIDVLKCQTVPSGASSSPACETPQ
jgi:hypothetical protein